MCSVLVFSDEQELNLPHQVLGIVVCAAVAANVSVLLSLLSSLPPLPALSFPLQPFLAIIRCDPQSQW